MDYGVVRKPELGFYGKIPSVGDFVHRGLPAASITLIDAWLQTGMNSVEVNEPSFYEHYMVSPIWFFMMPKGIWHNEPVAGLVMPSVDRVGRLFPLVVLLGIPQEGGSDYAAQLPVLAQAGADALYALHHRLSPDEFYEKLIASRGQPAPSDRVSAFDVEVFGSFSPDGTRSLWWRLNDSSVVDLKTLDNIAAEKLFPYLFMG